LCFTHLSGTGHMALRLTGLARANDEVRLPDRFGGTMPAARASAGDGHVADQLRVLAKGFWRRSFAS